MLNDFKDVLKYLRERSELSQAELANKLGLAKSTVSMYEVGKRQPDFETLELIADFFNVDMNFLLCRRSNSAPVRIPVLGRVAAGIPIDAVEYIVDWEEIPADMALTGEYFCLQIKGDSMEPKISDGDVVIVRKQEDADTGDLVIALVNGSDATCKRLMKYTDGIALISTNPKYAPLQYSSQEIVEKPVQIIGKVVELRAKF